jgi:hypothetical protein
MAVVRPWSFAAVAARMRSLGSYVIGRSTTAKPDAVGQAGIEIGGQLCTLVVVADAKAKSLTVILSPPFIVDSHKSADALLLANELNCRILEGRFVLVREDDGYQRLRYRPSVPQGRLVTTKAIDALVAPAVKLYAEWLPVLEAVSVTDESADEILDRIRAADRSHREDEKRAAGIPIVITHDDYQERLGQFLDASQPSGASSYDAHLLWVKNRTQEFHSFLHSQGIEVEDAVDASSWIPSWDGRKQ